MSDPREPKPTKPMKKTSSVPLRKETVRVTLKAMPQTKKDPSAPPAPPLPDSVSSEPPAPAPTIPLKTSTRVMAKPPAPAVAPAPTVMLQGGSVTQPATPAPAPTVKLNMPESTGPATMPLTGGPATKPLTSGPATTPLAGSAPATTQPLPKATVQLQQTQPMGAAGGTPSQAATIRTADDDDSANKSDGVATALSVVALIVALIVLGVQLGTANIWVHDTPQNPGWGQLIE